MRSIGNPYHSQTCNQSLKQAEMVQVPEATGSAKKLVTGIKEVLQPQVLFHGKYRFHAQNTGYPPKMYSHFE